ncbi:hypothetical protein GCM10022254_16390 [Actinomadura meridiana]|uniref:Uncharacterized protein n=1 Tax=Actinomadura meridiana TaxID=559626 RepID=A0ABP8BVQ6_9ACTN
MTLSASQADSVIMVASEEAVVEAERGDPRGVGDDCSAIRRAVRSQRRQKEGQVEVALTARQWDVAVAAIDWAVLRAVRDGEAEFADAFTEARDAVLAQAAEHLPVHIRQEVTARHRLTVGDAYGYILFQPSWRGSYGFGRIDESMLDGYNTPFLDTIGVGKAVAVQVRTGEVDVEIRVLPAAPEADDDSWETTAEITQQWTNFPYPELVLAVPGNEGTVLWDLATELWPHITYRMRLSVNSGNRDAEAHLVRMWPDHAAPPTVVQR